MECTFEEAYTLALQYLSELNLGVELSLFSEQTQEYDFGWIFFWNSTLFYRTKDPFHSLGGNSPFLIEKKTGELFELGTALPLDSYIEAYRRGGHPYACPTSNVHISGSIHADNRKAFLHLLRTYSSSSLLETNQMMRSLLQGEELIVSTNELESAALLERSCVDLGLYAKQLYEQPYTQLKKR